MTKWEYRWVELRSLGSQGETFRPFIIKLEEMGAEGWELCGFEYGMAFFKRSGASAA